MDDAAVNRITWRQVVRALLGLAVLIAILAASAGLWQFLSRVAKARSQPASEIVLVNVRAGSLPGYQTQESLYRAGSGKYLGEPSYSIPSGTRCEILSQCSYVVQVVILDEGEHCGKVYWVDEKYIRRR